MFYYHCLCLKTLYFEALLVTYNICDIFYHTEYLISSIDTTLITTLNTGLILLLYLLSAVCILGLFRDTGTVFLAKLCASDTRTGLGS